MEGSGTAFILENWALAESNAGALTVEVKSGTEPSIDDVNLSVLNPLVSLNPMTVPVGRSTAPLPTKLLPES